MKIKKTNLEGCVIIQPEIFHDERGFFLETFQSNRYLKSAGLNYQFVQDNFSRSKKGTLRGLHFQKNYPQGKLVRVVHGLILDVAVDLRSTSKTFGQHIAVELDDKLHQQLWVPPGFAHGFLVLSDYANVEYKCTDYYYPNDEVSIIWNDPTLDIKWPKNIQKIVSQKDSLAETFSSLFYK